LTEVASCEFATGTTSNTGNRARQSDSDARLRGATRRLRRAAYACDRERRLV